MRILLSGAILQSLLELLQITRYRELDQVNEMLSLPIKGLTRRSEVLFHELHLLITILNGLLSAFLNKGLIFGKLSQALDEFDCFLPQAIILPVNSKV
jgi:hypothetical protein